MGWTLAPEEGKADQDPGIVVKHASFGEDEFIRLRTVLTDKILQAASEKANRGERYNNAEYQVSAIMQMVLDRSDAPGWRVKDPTTGEFTPFTEDTIRRLPPQAKAWIVAEINKCDGAVAPAATLEVHGKQIPFRRTA